jgi:hypothetical protein
LKKPLRCRVFQLYLSGFVWKLGGKGVGGIFGEKKDEREVERMIPFRLLF